MKTENALVETILETEKKLRLHLDWHRDTFPNDVKYRLEKYFENKYSEVKLFYEQMENIEGNMLVRSEMFPSISLFKSRVESFCKDEGFKIKNSTTDEKENNNILYIEKENKSYMLLLENHYNNYALKVIKQK
jgi:hypothetical protein